MKRVGFFGGAFDPPHMGHYLGGAYYLACRPDARLLIVPSARHPFHKTMAPFEQRLAWCTLMAKALGRRAEVSPIEETLEGTGRTLVVLRALKQAYLNADFEIIVGADFYENRDKWYKIDELEREASFFVLGRGANTQGTHHLAMPEVSSTEIRRRLQAGESCEGLVPRVILDQVEASGVYRRE